MAELKLLHPHPALLVREGRERLLVLADLHIGFEEAFRTRGIKLTPATDKMRQEALALVERVKPTRLLILGDLKHGVEALAQLEWREVPALLDELAAQVDVALIPGNHDGLLEPLLPRAVTLLEPQGWTLGDAGFLHGHTLPSPALKAVKHLVMGHLHPLYLRPDSPLTGRAVWLLLRAERKPLFPEASGTLELTVLPAFNRDLSLTGYTGPRVGSISPILRRLKGSIREAAILTLEGELLGGSESLRYVAPELAIDEH